MPKFGDSGYSLRTTQLLHIVESDGSPNSRY